LAATLLVLISQGLRAQPTAFTYQGRLLDQNQPANGSYDISFGLKDAGTNGSIVGTVLRKVPVPVTNGIFTVSLDFGDTSFAGLPLWLEIGVRTNGSSAPYTVLSPLQAIAATPYAIFAKHSATAGSALSLSPGAALAGNGAGITNLNGANLTAGSINSNALDADTWNDLTNRIAARGGVGVNNTLTNPTFKIIGQSAAFLKITNNLGFASDLPTNFQNTNSLAMLVDAVGAREGNGISTFRFSVKDVNRGYMDWLYNPYHDTFTDWSTYTNYSMEMQTTMSGGWAVSTAYGAGPDSLGYSRIRRAWQWGIGGYGQPYIYHQGGLVPHSANTNLFDAMYPEFFIAHVYTNSSQRVAAGSLDPFYYWLPCIMFSAIDTNGNAAWTWYDSFSTFVPDNGQYDFGSAKERFRIVAGPNGGVSFNGTLASDGLSAITTNVFIGTTVLTFHNGLLVRCGVMDADAISFFTRAGGVSVAATNAVLAFADGLKADGTWTNFDAIYPFVGASAVANGQNLVSPAYPITWAGSFVTMDATGIQSDGITGYGDTGWKVTSQNACALFACFKTDGATAGANFALGTDDGVTSRCLIGHNGGASVAMALNSSRAQLAAVPPFAWLPTSVMVVRNNSAGPIWAYQDGVNKYFAAMDASQTPSTYNVFLCARNAQGSANGFWSASGGGKIQVVALANKAPSFSQYQTLHNACVALNAALGR
jgi:hypothetical protein